MPIYWAPVKELHESPPLADELMEIVRTANWELWQDLSLEDEDASVYRKGVHRLASEIIRRIEIVDTKPAYTDRPLGALIDIPSGSPDDADGRVSPASGAGADEEDEPGVLEILADGESALVELATDVGRMGPLMDRMTALAETATKETQVADRNGKGFAGRLAAARKYARGLDEVAPDLEALAQVISGKLLVVDPAIRLLVEQLGEQDLDQNGIDFLNSIAQMARSTIQATDSGEGLRKSLQENVKWSKELRKPTHRIDAALRQISDAQSAAGLWLQMSEAVLAKADPSFEPAVLADETVPTQGTAS